MTMRSRATLALSVLTALALATFAVSAVFGGGAHCSSSATASGGDHCASHMSNAAAAAASGDDDCAMHKASSAKAAAFAAQCGGGQCVVLSVAGMHCGNCEPEVEHALMKVKGVKAASADYSTGEAMVVLASSVPTKNLVKAVKKAGFKAELKAAEAPKEKSTSS